MFAMRLDSCILLPLVYLQRHLFHLFCLFSCLLLSYYPFPSFELVIALIIELSSIFITLISSAFPQKHLSFWQLTQINPQNYQKREDYQQLLLERVYISYLFSFPSENAMNGNLRELHQELIQ